MPREPRTRGGPDTGERILVVDDDPIVAESIAEVLASEGHEASTALNAVEALETLGGAETEPAADLFGRNLALSGDGRVLAAGGSTGEGAEGTGGGQTIHPSATAEVYDPERHRTVAFEIGTDPGVIAACFGGWALMGLGFLDQAGDRIRIGKYVLVVEACAPATV